MNEKTEKNISTLKTVMTILLIITVLAISKISGAVSIRILLSFFIFLLVLPLVSALEKAKFPNWLSTVIAVLVIVAVVLFFVWFVFFSVDMLIQKVPDYAARINDLDGLLKGMASKWIDIPEDVSFFSALKIDWVGSIIMPTLRSVSSSAISILSSVLLIILMTVFLLGERHVIIPKLLNFIKEGEGDKLTVIWERIIRQISKYITIKVFISILTGALFYVICLIVGLDFALLWGVLAVVLNFIPTIGSIIITVLVTLMAIIQFAPSIGPILFVGIGAILVQNIVGNFLDPRLSGNSLNLSPFIILVSLSAFGFVWGIVGMFLAVPLLSILQIICANVESTRPIAMLISSGRSYRKQTKERTDRRRTTRRNGKNPKGSEYGQFSDDIMFPDGK
ncbi:MAG: AI-2E family transporter [Spirochaetales bacterium]|nr:AI-2E family transporter [Spirochaetales bacterium]